MAKWRFPSNDYGENKGINDSGVALFRGTPQKSLAREKYWTQVLGSRYPNGYNDN